MKTVSTTATKTPMITRSFAAHLSHVSYGMRASARPPIMKPQVGVNRFTRPLAATLHIMEVSTDQLRPETIGETIGAESAARPEEDGTRKLRPI